MTSQSFGAICGWKPPNHILITLRCWLEVWGKSRLAGPSRDSHSVGLQVPNVDTNTIDDPTVGSSPLIGWYLNGLCCSTSVWIYQTCSQTRHLLPIAQSGAPYLLSQCTVVARYQGFIALPALHHVRA